MIKCKLLTLWYNIKLFKIGLKRGVLIMGHSFKYTGDVKRDCWVMQCSRCGNQALTDIGPKTVFKNA